MALRAVNWLGYDREDDATLVAAAQRGELRAQECLFRRYAPMVNGLAFRLLGNREDLDDLVQDSFLQAFRSLGRLEKPEAFRSWLAEIVVRMTHNLLRRRRLLNRLGLRTARPLDLETVIGPGAPPDVAAALADIYRLVRRLPSKVQVALILRRVEGRQLDEIAQLMGASLASVKRWVRSADDALAIQRGDGGEKR